MESEQQQQHQQQQEAAEAGVGTTKQSPLRETRTEDSGVASMPLVPQSELCPQQGTQSRDCIAFGKAQLSESACLPAFQVPEHTRPERICINSLGLASELPQGSQNFGLVYSSTPSSLMGLPVSSLSRPWPFYPGLGEELEIASVLLSMSTMRPKIKSIEVAEKKKKQQMKQTQSQKQASEDREDSQKSSETKEHIEEGYPAEGFSKQDAPVVCRMRKSCESCTRSKLRCVSDGVNPCERCTNQGKECIYVQQRKRGPIPGSLRQPQKRPSEPGYGSVSTPSSMKGSNRDFQAELVGSDPSPAEKKRKLSFSEIPLVSKPFSPNKSSLSPASEMS